MKITAGVLYLADIDDKGNIEEIFAGPFINVDEARQFAITDTKGLVDEFSNVKVITKYALLKVEKIFISNTTTSTDIKMVDKL